MTDFRLRRSHACRSCQVLTRHRTTNQASLFRSSSPVRFNRINMPHRLETPIVLYYIDTELDRWHAGHAPASWRSAYLPPIIALILQSRFRPQDVRDVDAVRWESDAVPRHSGDHVRLLPQKTEIPVSRHIFSTDSIK